MINAIAAKVDALARDPALRRVLEDEQSWLAGAVETVNRVQAFREDEMRRFWPAMWRRWAIAMCFSLASAVAVGTGYVWATRPHEAELVALRQRVELLDVVARSQTFLMSMD